MGYYNMIYQYGENKFLKNVKKSKVDGLILVRSYLIQKIKNLQKNVKKINLFYSTFVTNNYKEKIKKIIKDSHDMNYYISMLSTTGGKLKVFKKNIKNISIK